MNRLFLGIDPGKVNVGITLINQDKDLICRFSGEMHEASTHLKVTIGTYGRNISIICIEQPIPYARVPENVTVVIAYWFGELLGLVKGIYSCTDGVFTPPIICNPQRIISSRLYASGIREKEQRESIGDMHWAHNKDEYNSLSVHERDALACSLFALGVANKTINPYGNKLI